MRLDLPAAGRRLGGFVLDLALPAACVACRAEGSALCSACAASLWTRTGAPSGTVLGLPSDVPLPLVQLEWCAPFQGAVRRALHALKYGGERRLAQPLGQAAAGRWREAGIGGDVLVHVPVHAERARVRGYDQAALVAAACSDALGIRAQPWLERRRATRAQFELGRADRAVNVAGAFGLQPGAASLVRGRWVVLVDDVVTTGSTLVACAEVLMDAGARAVSALTIAREG